MRVFSPPGSVILHLDVPVELPVATIREPEQHLLLLLTFEAATRKGLPEPTHQLAELSPPCLPPLLANKRSCEGKAPFLLGRDARHLIEEALVSKQRQSLRCLPKTVMVPSSTARVVGAATSTTTVADTAVVVATANATTTTTTRHPRFRPWPPR
ncbi:hypothetical protein PG988_012944 [Apiospora saccharicola]